MQALPGWSDAALAGLACSMRTFSGPAVLALRGRIGGRAGRVMVALAVGELVADKTPVIGNRTEAPALAARLLSGGYTGWSVGGPGGGVAAALAAAAGTFAGFHARRLGVELTGAPDPKVAAVEDLVAYLGAAFATRDGNGGRPATL